MDNITERRLVMSNPIRVETLRPPDMYSDRQIAFAMAMARELGRGVLTLCEKPYKP